MPKTELDETRAEDCPVAWFLVLERARENGNFERAAEAQRQLRRLGIRVKYERQTKALRGATA